MENYSFRLTIYMRLYSISAVEELITAFRKPIKLDSVCFSAPSIEAAKEKSIGYLKAFKYYNDLEKHDTLECKLEFLDKFS